MPVRIPLVLLAVMFLSEGAVLPQTNVGNDIITVAYPVADLVVPISANQNAATITTSENELMARIAQEIAPTTWENVGGPGSMSYEHKGYVLHVRQTPKVHAEVKSFLEQLLREQVSIEVRIVAVSEKGLEAMERSGNAWSRIQWTKNDGIECALMDDVKLLRFLECVQGDRAAHIMQFPKVTVFDGQDATISAGIWTEMVGVDFPVKNKPAALPQNEKVFQGTQAHFLPTISADRRHITVQAEISHKQLSAGEFELAIAAKVPDQRTVAILAGSMLTQVRTEFASPLGRIPYVNRLVRNVGYSRDSAKLIVLMTPRIVRAEEILEIRPLRTKIQAEHNGKFPLILSQGGK